jgi:hypothetical protein
MRVSRAGLIALLITLPSLAGAMDGNKLLSECKGGETDNLSFGICFGYIQGVVHGAESYSTAMDLTLPFCMPENASAGQIRDIVVKYFEESPESRHYTASSSILVALIRAFPCS